jgi:hypothetical protein
LAMFLTLGFLPAVSNGPGGMLETGRRAGSVPEQVRRKVWNPYNRPCIMEGNVRIWRAGIVLC